MDECNYDYGDCIFPNPLYCAEDCPLKYIDDGSCDESCRVEACQYDGQDCAAEEP